MSAETGRVPSAGSASPRGSSAGSAGGEARPPSAGFAAALDRAGPGAGSARGPDFGGGPGGGRRGPLLYSDVVSERWRRPRRRGELPSARAVAEDVNPLCGDRVRFMLAFEDGRIHAARFLGDSCAICTASADVLAEMVEGRTPAEARRLGTADILEVLQIDVRPTRLGCVRLPLGVLAAALGGAA